MIKLNTIYNEDCLETLKRMPDGFVDLVLTDPPYGETGNKWDKHIDFAKWFVELERIIKPTGAIVFTSSTLLASKLIPLAPHLYKYDWVWQKDNGTNVVSANHQPLRVHELILVFGKQAVTYTPRGEYMKYNPQKTKGKAYTQTSGRQSTNWKGGKVEGFETVNTGDRHPVTVQKFNRDRGLHPTQKPVALFEHLIHTYTDEGDTVYDPFMGSGTTAKACQCLNRNYIGSEISKEYCEIATKRLAQGVLL